MTDPEIDYAAVFQTLPGMVALLSPDLVFLDANEEFLRTAGRTREQVIGGYLFDVFPDNPNQVGASGVHNLHASLRRVLATGERDTMALQRYDVESPERPGEWQERYWSPVNAPVLDSDGRVVLIVHRVAEVTELIVARGAPDGSRARVLEAELYTRARELQEVNDRLRQAHSREREVALVLQEAMLPAPGDIGHHRAAVRYRPAVGALNVCGDWYDLVDLPGDRIAVAVGDVVGHGLHAAGVMGLLRSALSAASSSPTGPPGPWRSSGCTPAPSRAPRTPPPSRRTSTGRPTPSPTAAPGTPARPAPPPRRRRVPRPGHRPPLGARPEHVPRPQAVTGFGEGDTLVLYTDGLVERRREDIDVGLARLTRALTRHRGSDPEALADAILLDLLPPGGSTDDTALVVVRL